MELTYRCMRCGNNIVPLTDETPVCKICVVPTILVLVTEENKASIPKPTNPPGVEEIDFNDPSRNCQCAPGLCPCGKFVSHLASEAWDPENPNVSATAWEEWNKEKNKPGHK